MSLYKLLLKIPVISTVCSILVGYAFRGEEQAVRHFSWLVAITKALLVPMMISFAMTAIVLHEMVGICYPAAASSIDQLDDFVQKPGALIIGVIPSLLGFGIGVYALVFIAPTKLVNGLHHSWMKSVATGRRRYGSVLSITADLAFPLIVMIFSIAAGVVQRSFPESLTMLVVAWIMFWMSITALVEIVGVLYHLGDHAILDKLKKSPP